MRIDVFHNIQWPRYKGSIFGAMHRAAATSGDTLRFTHIAETEAERTSLGGVDLRYHAYPHEVIFPGNYYGTPWPKRAWALLTRGATSQADLVVLPGYERPEYWVMLLTLMARRKPRAVFCDSTANDQPRSSWKYLAKRFFFSRCHGFFAYGSRTREYLMSHGVPAHRVYHHCQAAALPLEYTEELALAARQAALRSGGGSPRFLFVGRLVPGKGLDTLLQAFQRVLADHPHSQLRLAGAGPLGPELERTAVNLGVADAVVWLGSLSLGELAREYAGATALVLPSTSEAWGLVVNEALSHGCPVIVSDICGCVPELVVHRRTGRVFQAGSTESLSQAMAELIGEVAQGSLTPGVCIEHMRTFSPEQAARRILAGCREIVARRHV